MTTSVSRSRKAVRFSSWFAIGRDSTRSRSQVLHQFAQQSSSFGLDRYLLMRRDPGHKPVAPPEPAVSRIGRNAQIP
jgi:hypothetical protein